MVILIIICEVQNDDVTYQRLVEIYSYQKLLTAILGLKKTNDISPPKGLTPMS